MQRPNQPLTVGTRLLIRCRLDSYLGLVRSRGDEVGNQVRLNNMGKDEGGWGTGRGYRVLGKDREYLQNSCNL